LNHIKTNYQVKDLFNSKPQGYL